MERPALNGLEIFEQRVLLILGQAGAIPCAAMSDIAVSRLRRIEGPAVSAC